MKSQSTMLALAKARALSNGPLVLDERTGQETKYTTPTGQYLIGYGLTVIDLMRIYTDNGFSMRTRMWEDHIKSWEFGGKVERIDETGWILFHETGRAKELAAIDNVNTGHSRVIA